MTTDSDFRKLVRARMKEAGETYTVARAALLAEGHVENVAATLEGWHVTGPSKPHYEFELSDYAAAIDPELEFEGLPTAYLESVIPEPKAHAVIMQSIDTSPYQGKRIRFSAAIRCDERTEDADLWLRVVPYKREWSFAAGSFDATTEWQDGAIVIDVNPHASSIMFGLSLSGVGKVWMSNACFEIVDKSVPLAGVSLLTAEPVEPANLSFTEASSVRDTR